MTIIVIIFPANVEDTFPHWSARCGSDNFLPYILNGSLSTRVQIESRPNERKLFRTAAQTGEMAIADPKAELHRYLQAAREALLWKLDGLSEYDVRRPLTPTGTNLLGLVKHVASVEFGYFGDTFGRLSDEPLPWFDEGAEPNADLWVTPAESREQIISLYHRAWAHTDATIEALPLDAVGHVPWWPENRRDVTLHTALVHMIAETHRHAGHADIVRELIDGVVGLRSANDNMPPGDTAWWETYRGRLERAAQQARQD